MNIKNILLIGTFLALMLIVISCVSAADNSTVGNLTTDDVNSTTVDNLTTDDVNITVGQVVGILPESIVTEIAAESVLGDDSFQGYEAILRSSTEETTKAAVGAVIFAVVF